MIRHALLTIIAFLLLAITAMAQLVKGKITDADSGKPIAHASIYLNGTSKGTVSNSDGTFTLSTAEKNIPLVFSCVGYQSQTINNYSDVDLKIALKLKATSLREVVIGGMSREEQLKIFLTQFLGSTSKDCVIENTIDINFTYSKKNATLLADASEPLLITNKKLGYKITYFLSYFKHSPQGIHYEGNYFFAEDTTGLQPKEIKKILKTRDEVYFGSRMHFIRSLWFDDLENNKYSVTDPQFNTMGTTLKLMSANGGFHDKKLLAKAFYDHMVKVSGGQKYLTAINALNIRYGRDISYAKLNENIKEVLIDSTGYFGPNVIWSGEMSMQRVNVMLPFEFKPLKPLSEPPPQRQIITNPVLASMVTRQGAYMQYFRPEKLYLQTDKPYYTTGDTLKFKAYLLNADYLNPSNRTGIIYVQLDDNTGKNATRIMVPVTDGLAWGDIALDKKDIPEGTYTLRAYTNWMRNFGEDYVYKQNITVSSITNNVMLVKANFKQQTNNQIATTLQFSSLDGKLQVLKDMELKVMAGRKNLSKDKVTTTIDGTIQVNFDVPSNTALKDLSIKARDITKGITNAADLTIPVTIRRTENTDIQFMAEGGNLAAGIPAKVGFKAIGEDGKGVTVTGRVINSKGLEVVQLKTSYAGMGSFTFTPAATEIYTVKINGINKTYTLPMVKSAGTVLNIATAPTDEEEDDALSITVQATTPPVIIPGQKPVNTTYYLIGQARGVICYAETIDLANNQKFQKTILKRLFPSGIARFTLMNADRQPVNERIVFINHYDNLNFALTRSKTKYTTRDSIALDIQVTDKGGRPVQGSFSLAVTDDNQVKQDQLQSNIVSNLLLTSDLKGTVEEPNYYFVTNKKDKNAKEADLDNLMLTQGWVGYDWKDVFKPKPPAFEPEKEFIVKGKVTNVFGKEIERSKVSMLLNKPFAARDTLTDSLGRFVFHDLFPLDSAVINLQARNKRGKEFNVGMEVEEFKAPEFKPTLPQAPWYVNSDSLSLKNSQTKAAQLKAVADYNGEGQMLKEVNIVDTRIIKGSKNLNGPGEADEILDEDFMHKANHKSLEKLLTDKYGNLFQKEFRVGGSIYRLRNHIVNFIIDGVFIAKLGLRVDDYMEYLSAEDIKGIEIMNSPKYAVAYDPVGYMRKLAMNPDRFIPIFLEVTTYSGNGAFLKKTPGIYLYRPLHFTLPKQFYTPKYTPQNSTIAIGTDMRSTLHWEPNIMTNAEGKATVSFYSADKPADYSVIIEGTDLDGQIGYGRQKLKIAPAK